MSSRINRDAIIAISPYVSDFLDYNHMSGKFVWKIRRSAYAIAGSNAGTLHKTGYVVIQINGRSFYAHHIAWLLHYGEIPVNEIDHINRDKSDNRIENLRDATRSENLINRCVFKNSTSKIKCVSFHRQSGKWQARITCGTGRKYIGLFETISLAETACRKALDNLKGDKS